MTEITFFSTCHLIVDTHDIVNFTVKSKMALHMTILATDSHSNSSATLSLKWIIGNIEGSTVHYETIRRERNMSTLVIIPVTIS